jgi:hypothetical protein
MTDAEIASMVEEQGALLVTRNYKDFKQLSGVIRVSGKTELFEQVRVTLNSLEAARLNPGIWERMKHIPASGLNTGTF